MKPHNLPKAAAAALLALALAGCVNPKDFETDPVEVPTTRGVVTCQLYTQDLVVWDRAIDRPDAMSVSDADAICMDEGKRRAKIRHT